MGNLQSNINQNGKTFKNFYEIIDYVATYYILTMDFQSLSKLSNKDYCNKLVVLTSDIIKTNFNELEVTYLEQRIKNGLEINDLTTDNLIFLNKTNIDELNISNKNDKIKLKKKRSCIGIAKFYVKIAHIFAAIVMTINPTYVYKGQNGEIIKKGLLEKNTIPKNTPRKIYKMNICDNRVHALQKNEDYISKYADKTVDTIKIHPTVCEMNVNTNNDLKTLNDEPGIKELKELYMDDYNYSTGEFTKMSKQSKIQFEKDLKSFYTAFTGNRIMPDNIKTFNDIKLKNYSTMSQCQGKTPAFSQTLIGDKNDVLFKKYAQSIKYMIQDASTKQNELLNGINNLFTFVIDPKTKTQQIRVNPHLNEAILQKTVEDTRKTIVELYINCEKDYVTSVKLYEAIVESKILETTKNQIKNLETQTNELINYN